jgi:hypothetical protein
VGITIQHMRSIMANSEIKIDRGETIKPTVGANRAVALRTPFDHAAEFHNEVERVAKSLELLGPAIEKLAGRVNEQSLRLEKLAAREKLRKSAALSKRDLADARGIEALEQLDENDPLRFERAVVGLVALKLPPAELAPRIEQIRRAALQRNPKLLPIVDKYGK